MAGVSRYWRAFIVALRMTARGEKPPPNPNAEWLAWAQVTVARVDAVYRAAEAAGLNQAARHSVTVRLDGRDMKLDTILNTFRYHASHEYPSLLRSSGRFNRNAVQAANMNDLYWLARVREQAALQQAGVQAALDSLSAHLESIPNIPSKQNPS